MRKLLSVLTAILLMSSMASAEHKIWEVTDPDFVITEDPSADDERTSDKIAKLIAAISEKLDEYERRVIILEKKKLTASQSGQPESAPTTYAEVIRVLGLLPKPEVGFIDFGCGADARWCIAAAEKWGCKAIGIEIDPLRAAMAKRRVQDSGLGHLVTIIQGDAVTTDVPGDVAVAYLYPQTLTKLKPRFEKLRAFASFIHQPPGLPVVRNGDAWIYTRPVPMVSVSQPVGYWNGVAYSAAATGCNCPMCQSLRQQIGSQSQVMTQPQSKPVAASPSGRMVRQKVCTRQGCYFVDVWVPD